MCVLRAVLVDAYFIAHHYGGRDLWRLQNVPDAHEMRFALTLCHFQPLYPATLNLLQVAAAKRPGLRCYEWIVMPLAWHAIRSNGA